MASDPTKVIQTQVDDVLSIEKNLQETENELMQNEQFRTFLEQQKEFRERSTQLWKHIEEQMIKHGVKSLKGDWGSITIAERLGWNINQDELQSKYYKKAPDLTKISGTFKLEGKAPKGCEPKYTQYLTKRIK